MNLLPNKVTLTVSERLDEFTIVSRNHSFSQRASETIEETILRINNLPLDDGGFFVVSVPTSREQIGIITYKL